VPERRCGRKGSAIPPHAPHIDPIATGTHRETYSDHSQEDTYKRDSPIEIDPRYADAECQDEEFSRCDAG
jgi:hypothetical protein